MSGKFWGLLFFKEDDTEEVTFEQRSEENEGGSHVDVWGKVFRAEGTGSAKALRWERASTVAGVECTRGSVEGSEDTLTHSMPWKHSINPNGYS